MAVVLEEDQLKSVEVGQHLIHILETGMMQRQHSSGSQ